MPIQSQCPICEREVSLPDGLAGNSARCPMCGATFKLPDKPGINKPPPQGPLDTVLAEIDPDQIFAAIKLPETDASIADAAVATATPQGDQANVSTETADMPPALAKQSAVEAQGAAAPTGPITEPVSDENEDGPIPLPPDPVPAAPAMQPADSIPATPQPVEEVGARQAVDHLRMVVQDGAPHRRRRFMGARSDSSPALKAVMVLLLMVLSAGVGYLMHGYLNPPVPVTVAWEIQNKDRLRNVLADVQELEGRARYRSAYDMADAVWSDIVGRRINDPEVQALCDQIRQVRDRLALRVTSTTRTTPSTTTTITPSTRPARVIPTTRPTPPPTTLAATQPAPTTRPAEIVTTAPSTQVAATLPATRPVASTRPKTPLDDDFQIFANLLQQATNALAAGEAQAAVESLLDANSLFEKKLRARGLTYGSPEHVAILHGLAISYQLLDRQERAATLFQMGSPLDRACAAKTATRQLLVTRALSDSHLGLFALRSVMRLCEYIKAHPNELDNEMLDVLYTALHRADETLPTRSPTLETAFKLYDAYNAQLMATRPGYKRWGVKWVTQDEYAQYAMRHAIGVRNYELTQAKLDEETQAVVESERALEDARRTRDSQIINQASERLAAARRVRAATVEAVKKSKSNIPEPPILSRADCRRLLLPREIAIASTAATGATTAPVAVASRRIGEGEYNLGGIEVGAFRLSTQPSSTTQPMIATPVPSTPTIPIAAPPSRRSFSRTAAGFAVGPDLILTSAAPLANASRVNIELADGQQMTGVVLRIDPQKGLALLKVAGQSMAYMNLAEKSGEGNVMCPCFPEVSLFGARQINVPGLIVTGSSGLLLVNLERHPRLAGAPLLDSGRNVVGIEMADREAPVDRCPMIPVEALRVFLEKDLPQQLCGNPGQAPVVQVTAAFEK